LPKDYDPTFSLMTFIAGPHHCIGRQMSIIEMKTVILMLIGNFKFDYSEPGQEIPADSAITMKASLFIIRSWRKRVTVRWSCSISVFWHFLSLISATATSRSSSQSHHGRPCQGVRFELEELRQGDTFVGKRTLFTSYLILWIESILVPW